MDFFYTPPRLVTPPLILIEGEELSHLVHVMRKKVRDIVTVVDGTGNLYEVEITRIERRSASCTIMTHRIRPDEPARKVILGAALLRNAGRFDVLVEKTTEIGVHEIIPLRTTRTIPHHARVDRWQKLALAAMKQSQRSYLPAIRQPVPFSEFVDAADRASVRLIPHEAATGPPLKEAIPPGTETVVLAVGPEGGFSDEEIAAACDRGFTAVRLGPRRLRAETAAIIATAAVLL